ncbi:family 20 glycosylhydrolase [Kribbella sandramycini]|uniref:beta-N-acetylhexosaminidase n=1 Tax=Kribbella sandramycini TaxID=60450 RepID=A0A7Y4P0R4_9ACTN|nr:family 20 glycosylhydrolase [Kribbella sandramycini]MBB6571165.1 hexosaminidase [Kribbella sandramycini]NOL43427.1 family 20 glycosylhydrolase [Kribbella sandramycini]
MIPKPFEVSLGDGTTTVDLDAVQVTIEAGGLEGVPAAAGLRADGVDVDERYGVEITADGVRVWGPSDEAVFRGLTTLRQLVALHGDAVPCQRIVDGPRFAWRGLSFDVVRTFHPPETVRRVIDICALYKLNVLHLHLTDDQGWRFEVPSRPELVKFGSTGAIGDRPGGHYTRADVANLVQYAAERFVTLVPEVDMPGHSQAVFRSIPELAPTEIRTIDVGDDIQLQLGTLDPDRPATWSFVDDVLDAVIAQFPQSAYVHLGGDEAWGMPDAAHAAFVEQAAARIRARGKRVIGWQEIARADLDPADVVQYWIETTELLASTTSVEVPADLLPILVEHLQKAQQDLPKAHAQGTPILVSAHKWLYFDRPHGDSSTDPGQEEQRRRVGLPHYPPTTIQDGYDWDPLDATPGATSDTQLAGVEAAIWCETVTTRSDLEFLLLPRLPAAAEKAWSHTPDTWPGYADRLARQAPLWRAHGWEYFKSAAIGWK